MTVRGQVELLHTQLQESTKAEFGEENSLPSLETELKMLLHKRFEAHIEKRLGHLDVERILDYLKYLEELQAEPVVVKTNEEPEVADERPKRKSRAKSKAKSRKAKGKQSK